ncbi:hypothetical protein Tco_0706926 [Tanacetum coccineum]|uniref:Transposase (Putative), gypsy type n=1 Tax=Tanacetum coccineum TaxID=301880 RepID=A0ABQ4Y8U3_9ASTR
MHENILTIPFGAAHEVPLLTATASCVIDMKDPAMATESSGTPSVIEKSPHLSQHITESDGPEDQVQEIVAPEILPPGNVSATRAAPEVSLEEEVVAMGHRLSKKRRERGNDRADANAPPKMLRKDHATSRPTYSILEGKSLASMGVEPVSTSTAPAPSSKGAIAGDPDSEKSYSFTSLDVMDHIVPPGYFSELRHMPNDDFLSQYNINLARQVAMGSQLRLRFEQEVRLRKRATEKIAKPVLLNFFFLYMTIAKREQRIQATKEEIKNLDQEIKSLKDVDLNVQGLRVRPSSTGYGLDALIIDFDEELYPHMLTAIAGRRWVIGHSLRLAVMKCAESTEIRQAFANVVSTGLAKGMSEVLKYGLEHGKAGRDLADVEAYDPKANNKLVKALQDLKELKYPMIDQLEKLKDALMELIMASLHLKSDTGEDAPYRAEKKKKCRVVCRTHGIGSAHHAGSDGILVSVPTVIPQGLAILLTDAGTQTQGSTTSNDRMSQQVSTLQAQVTRDEKLKAVFKEFKKYKDDRVEKRCAEMDARLDALSIDFDEELYPHLLTAIAGHQWVIGHGLRLAVMKCDESTELRQVFADVVMKCDESKNKKE